MGKLIINSIPNKILWGYLNVSLVFVGDELVWPVHAIGFNIYLDGVLQLHADIPKPEDVGMGTARGQFRLNNYVTGESTNSYIEYEVSIGSFYGTCHNVNLNEYRFDYIEYGSNNYEAKNIYLDDENVGWDISRDDYESGGNYVNLYLKRKGAVYIHIDDEVVGTLSLWDPLSTGSICLGENMPVAATPPFLYLNHEGFRTSYLSWYTHTGYSTCYYRENWLSIFTLKRMELIKKSGSSSEVVASGVLQPEEYSNFDVLHSDVVVLDEFGRPVWDPNYKWELHVYFESHRSFTIKLMMLGYAMYTITAPFVEGAYQGGLIEVLKISSDEYLVRFNEFDAGYRCGDMRKYVNGVLLTTITSESDHYLYVQDDYNETVVEIDMKEPPKAKYLIFYNNGAYPGSARGFGYGESMEAIMGDGGRLRPAHYIGGYAPWTLEWQDKISHYLYCSYDAAREIYIGYYENHYDGYTFDHMEWWSDVTPKLTSYIEGTEFQFTKDDWENQNATVAIYLTGPEAPVQFFEPSLWGLFKLEPGVHNVAYDSNGTVTVVNNGDSLICHYESGEDFYYQSYNMGRWVFDEWGYYYSDASESPSGKNLYTTTLNPVTIPKSIMMEGTALQYGGTFVKCHFEVN